MKFFLSSRLDLSLLLVLFSAALENKLTPSSLGKILKYWCVEILSHPGHGCPKGAFDLDDLQTFSYILWDEHLFKWCGSRNGFPEEKIADYKNHLHYSGDPEDRDKPPGGLNDSQKGCKRPAVCKEYKSFRFPTILPERKKLLE